MAPGTPAKRTGIISYLVTWLVSYLVKYQIGYLVT